MIGIIGVGNMGRAIASRLNKRILISDVYARKLRNAKKKNTLIAKNNIDLAKRADIIILAVKPQNIARVLKEIAPCFKGKSRTKDLVRDKLIISIAAGIKTKFIEKRIGKARVIRIMPNMPAIVGKGVSALVKGRFASKKDLAVARMIFLTLGSLVEVRESLMDAVTAVSGSGPAYYFLFTEALEKAAVELGLNKRLASQLAKATFIGAAEVAKNTDISMRDFIDKVASKGGTTEAALKTFKKTGFERIVKEALKAARNRSRCLSN